MTDAGTSARARGRAWWLALVALIGVWYVTLAPSSLGGPLTLVITRGESMEPTLRAGDLAVAYRDRSPEPGDAIVAPHPSGPFVVHRIVAIGPEGIVTQGDGMARPDAWRTDPEDVVGTVRFRVPGAWRVLAFLARPLTLGVLAAVAVFAAVGLRHPRPTVDHGPGVPAAAVALVAAVAVPAVAEGLAASLTVTAADLTVSRHHAPFETYVDTPVDGGGDGGGGGGCTGKGRKPGCP